MDQTILQSIFSEKGVIVGLFVITFVLFLYKGLPFLIKMIFTQQELQHAMYKLELQNITDAFRESVKTISDNSTAWHNKHSEDIQEIKGILKRKYQGKEDIS